MLVFVVGCGGGSGEDPFSSDSWVETEGGIEFFHNDFYTDEELNEAASVVDEYFIMAQECAVSIYPDIADTIYALPVRDMEIVVRHPDKYNPETGREAFSCAFSEKGCAGTYDVGGPIHITPSLDALGHEMGHWMNFMLFGETSDENPTDLSRACTIKSICHLYSKNRNLIACR